jgi:hypothetical protein
MSHKMWLAARVVKGASRRYSRAMTRLAWLAAPVLAAAIAAPAALAQQRQPTYGCLAYDTCGKKSTTTNGGPRDYWQNWICAGCHLGGLANYQPSPAERALLAVPARFWVMHAEAERGGETRARIRQHPLLPTNRLPPAFRRLMAERPAEQH